MSAFAKPSQRLLLFPVELTRDVDLEPVEDVSLPLGRWALESTFSAKPLHRSVLGPGGNPDPFRPVQGRDLDGSSLDRLGDRDRNRHLEVAVGSLLEYGRRRDAGRDVQVPRRTAAGSVLALAGEADAAAVADARAGTLTR